MDLKAEVIIHCAAYIAIDEPAEGMETCYQIDEEAVKVIAQCFKELDVNMIYINTDYVFDESKLKGEQYVQEILQKYYIVRISWVFEINGNNFIE